MNDNKTYLNIGTLNQYAAEGSSIKISKLSNDKYNWEIKIYGEKPKAMLKTIVQIDKDMRQLFGQPSEVKGEK